MVRRDSPKATFERLNSGLIVALAWCVAMWMVLYGLYEGFVAK